jgi:type I restriction enzyme S subunit
MDLEQGFKQTDFGVIPEDWLIDSLGNLGQFNKGSGVKKDESQSGDLACIRYGELYTKHHNIINQCYSFISPEVSKSAKKIKSGDILFAGSGETKEEIGKCAAFIKEYDAFAGGDIIIFTPKNCSSIFLGYLLNSRTIVKQKASKGQGDAVVHISSKELSKIIIPYPPIKEQNVIAQALLATDTYISILEKLIEKKQQIKLGVMHELLKPKSGWIDILLTDVVDFIHGKAHEQFIVENGKYKVVNSKFVSSEGRVVKFSNYSFLTAKKNDILTVLSDLPNGKALAKCFFVDLDNHYAVNQRICIWRSRSADPKFLFYVLNRHPYFLALNDGVSQTHILNHHIKKCQISIPSNKSEQENIGKILTSIDEELIALEIKLEKTKCIKQGMMQNLLTGKIRLL